MKAYDKTKQYTFQVLETGKKIRETYIMQMTGEEMTSYLRNKEELNGYIPGMGGDKTYSIIAWTINEHGWGYVDIERIWAMFDLKAAI